MMRIRRSVERGGTSLEWLDSRHSFSFGEYYDPRHVGFGPLRVINEDIVAPRRGFATHGHRDMEIVTYVLSGALEHRDSLGSGSVIRPGEIQRMSAGTGIRHSEINPSDTDPVHLLQIWILPEAEGIRPSYEQTAVSDEVLRDRLGLVASRTGRNGSLTIHADVNLFAARLSSGALVEHLPAKGRGIWVQIARGVVTLNGERLIQGDGVALGTEALRVEAFEEAEVLVFDMAM